MTYTYGHIIAPIEQPRGHIPPLYGRTTVEFKRPKYQLEAYALYNGPKPIECYALTGKENPLFALPSGTPGWYTLNLKGVWRISRVVSVSGGVENILDRHYRPFMSGISAPGRNFLLGLDVTL